MNLNFNKILESIIHMPDGQPHLNLDPRFLENDPIHICISICSTEDLFVLGLLVDVLRRVDRSRKITLHLHYLLGSRMDRAISLTEPNTLKVVCDFLLSLNVDINVTFPHSSTILDRLNCKQNIFNEENFITDGIEHFSKKHPDITIILPDAGAEKRFWNDHKLTLEKLRQIGIKIDGVVGCTKHRDMKTGKLSGFSVNGDVGKNCVIIDDLVDGGFTYVLAAKALREKGAAKIFLCVYHAILSKGLPIKGIDGIYTTNSFTDFESDDYLFCKRVV